MKTTMMFRNIANPRRTTLAHLTDADELQTPEQPEHADRSPTQTANPRRTILMEPPPSQYARAVPRPATAEAPPPQYARRPAPPR